MRHTELPKAYDPRDVEARWYKFWLEHDFFHADANIPKTPYSIVLPPPNVTGSLHMGHALTGTIQDILVRWRRMQAYNAMWLPGTDHAGIATQIMVERDLQRAEGKTRHDIGRDAFLERVWSWKERHGDRIVEQMQALGQSCDWQRQRFTMDPQLSRAVVEAFVRLHEQGLIYRSRRLINWDPDHQTALSDLEVDNVDEKGSLWEIRYPIVGSEEHLTVATTRPETLFGDSAVAVHPEDERFKHLVGKRCRVPLCDRDIPIVGDAELVSMEFGTGAVKVTPAHDFNDFATGQRHDLEQIEILDRHARVCAPAPDRYIGLSVTEARARVLEDLEAAGLLVGHKDHTVPLGRSQRSGAVVEPMLSEQWFVSVEPLAKRAIEAVEKGRTRFVPEHFTKTYMHWMTNIEDWCISRQLWWGHRIPAWHCAGCSEITVARETPTQCSSCGSKDIAQDEDVLDTWFSSGLWPFSTLGWPEETRELRTFYPTTVLETGHDILFFWVARMMMMGLHFMNKVPFRTVYLHSMVVDEDGQKMSKTKGNVIDPLDVVKGASADELLDKARHGVLDDSIRKKVEKRIKKSTPDGYPAMGADALRFTLAAQAGQGRSIRLSIDRVEGYRHFANKLWNASRFTLMNLEGFEADDFHDKLQEGPGNLQLTLADRWILSRLQRVVEDMDRALGDFRFNDAAQQIYAFVWGELCDWYIELVKPELGDIDTHHIERRFTAQGVLSHCLETSLRLMHPFMPFVTEEIWQKLPKPAATPVSIMITLYPIEDARYVDTDAENEMTLVMDTVTALRNLRAEYNVAPSKTLDVFIAAPETEPRHILEEHLALVERIARVTVTLSAEPAPEQKQAAKAALSGGIELVMPLVGIIDMAAERTRLEREIGKLEKDVAQLDKKLANASFLERAPAEVVEEQRTRLQSERSRLDRLTHARDMLGD